MDDGEMIAGARWTSLSATAFSSLSAGGEGASADEAEREVYQHVRRRGRYDQNARYRAGKACRGKHDRFLPGAGL
jgi:hypothetical protein